MRLETAAEVAHLKLEAAARERDRVFSPWTAQEAGLHIFESGHDGCGILDLTGEDAQLLDNAGLAEGSAVPVGTVDVLLPQFTHCSKPEDKFTTPRVMAAIQFAVTTFVDYCRAHGIPTVPPSVLFTALSSALVWEGCEPRADLTIVTAFGQLAWGAVLLWVESKCDLLNFSALKDSAGQCSGRVKLWHAANNSRFPHGLAMFTDLHYAGFVQRTPDHECSYSGVRRNGDQWIPVQEFLPGDKEHGYRVGPALRQLVAALVLHHDRLGYVPPRLMTCPAEWNTPPDSLGLLFQNGITFVFYAPGCKSIVKATQRDLASEVLVLNHLKDSGVAGVPRVMNDVSTTTLTLGTEAAPLDVSVRGVSLCFSLMVLFRR